MWELWYHRRRSCDCVLEPHLTRSYKRETKVVREGARKNLDDENNALLAKLRQMRGQQ
jgi:hypothetical protein